MVFACAPSNTGPVEPPARLSHNAVEIIAGTHTLDPVIVAEISPDREYFCPDSLTGYCSDGKLDHFPNPF